MNADFSKPQRQSPIGVVVMFADAVQAFARALAPFLVIWIFRFRETQIWFLALGLLLFTVVIGTIAYLRYRNFTFFLDAATHEFILTEGILSKTKTAIQVSKIQKVDIKQSLLQRIIGVHTLEIDTAGSHKMEVAIKAMTHQLALDLKERLLSASELAAGEIQTETTLADAARNQAQPFVRISLGSLVKMGFTAHYVRSFALMLAFFISIYENLRQVVDEVRFDTKGIEHTLARASYFQIISLALLVLILLILTVNMARMVFRYFGYTISRQHESLLLSFGLLNTKNTIIRPSRVQFVTLTQNYFQRKLDILELKIKQATSGEKENRKTAIDIPGCNASERDQILQLLFKQIPEKGLMLKPNWRKVTFAVFLTVVLPVLVFLFLRRIQVDLVDLDYGMVLYAIGMTALQVVKFLRNRLFVGDKFVIKQSGAWDIRQEIVTTDKIQALSTSQLFWHKSLNIGSLTLHTAGGDIGFQLGNFETIKQYANLWLYEMETSNRNWM